MGSLFSSREKKLDKELAKRAKTKNREDNMIQKVLLLGAGESGKSTVYKQMMLCFGAGFNEENRLRSKLSLLQMMIDAMNDMTDIDFVELRSSLNEADELKDFDEEKFVVQNVDALTRFQEQCMSWDDRNQEEAGEILGALWSDEGIQYALQYRVKLMLPDNLDYFFDNVIEIFKQDYELSNEDILRLRVRTTGVTSDIFLMDGSMVRVTDVGGQRNERRKWIDQFDSVEAIMFVTGISDYDMNCFEDSKTNRMHESMGVWRDVVENKALNTSTLVLFLNKFDLFKAKYEAGVSLNTAFPDFEGGDIDAALRFIEDKHLEISGSRDVVVHVTTATDSNQMKPIITAVRHATLTKNLGELAF